MIWDFNCNWNFSSSIILNFFRFFRQVYVGQKNTFFCCCFSGQILSHIVLCVVWTFELNLFDPIEFMSRHTTLYILWSFIWILIHGLYAAKKLVYLSLLISPHRKEMGEIVFWSFFSQGLEEMHHELSKDGENHKLGDVNIPAEPKHSRFAHL